MSAILDTKRFVERRLKTSFPNTKIAFEGVSFEAPNDELYIRTQLVIQPPDEPVIGDTYYRERFSFQVFVCDVQNKGTANAYSIAEQVRALFRKGSTSIEQSTPIHITSVSRLQGPIITEDRLVIAVLIELWAEVYN